MQNKFIIVVLITAIIVGGFGFFIGKSMNSNQTVRFGNFANMTDEERQNLMQNASANMQGGRVAGGRAAAMSALVGEVTDKDNQSITLKLSDGSSKIIFYSSSTTISQFQESNINDLVLNQTVMISGKTNDDGSITAQSVQIRPQGVEPVNFRFDPTQQQQ